MFIFVCTPVVCKPIEIVMRPTQMSSSPSLQTIPQNTMNFIKTPWKGERSIEKDQKTWCGINEKYQQKTQLHENTRFFHCTWAIKIK